MLPIRPEFRLDVGEMTHDHRYNSVKPRIMQEEPTNLEHCVTLVLIVRLARHQATHLQATCERCLRPLYTRANTITQPDSEPARIS